VPACGSLAVATLLFVASANGASTPASVRSALQEAAAAQDLPRFDAALDRARSFIETMPLGARRNALRRVILIAADLGRVWHFAAFDPPRLFYDDDSLVGFYDHLVADYRPYAQFIEQYRVVDDAGRVFYPTRETRGFLLKQLETATRSSP
jgi:hypothetical protein